MAAAAASARRRSTLTIRHNSVPRVGMSSVMKKLLGFESRDAPNLEEELAEMRRKEIEDLAALEQELEERHPSEEELRLQALRRQAEALRARPRRRRAQRRREPELPGPAAGQARSEPREAVQAKLESAEASADDWSKALEASKRASAAANEAIRASQLAMQEAKAWTDLLQSAMAKEQRHAGAVVAEDGGFEAIFDAGSGRWYYHNKETEVTTWELPTEDIQLTVPESPSMAERPPEPPAPWELELDEGSGAWYYHNLATGETSWEAPRGNHNPKGKGKGKGKGKFQP